MSASVRGLSPRLAAVCEESDEIRVAIKSGGIFTTQDLLALGMDADSVASRLRVGGDAKLILARVFTIAKAQAEGHDEERMAQTIDVLNGEGEFIMRRSRGDVHRLGMWHRTVNVWVVCPSTSRVLLGQRAANKDVDSHRWTCVCGRVPSGELSMNTAVARLATEFSIQAVPDQQIFMVFSMKCPRTIESGVFAGQHDGAWADVYLATIEEEIPTARLHLDVRAKQAAKYASLAELQRAYEVKDESYVTPPNDEYIKKLMHYLRKTCKA